MPSLVSDDLRSFIEYLNKTSSENTVIAYSKDLGEFVCFLEKKGRYSFQEVTHLDIREYLTGLSDRLTRSSMNRKLSSIKSLFKFLKLKGVITRDLSKKVVSGKNIHRYPEVLNSDEISSILNYSFPEDRKGKRDAALLELLYSTGCRVSEVAGLNSENVDLLSGTAKVLGKGSRERIVPLGSYSIRRLHEYMRIRTDQFWGTDEPALFITVRANRMTDRSIRRVVVKYAKLAGISKTIGPHTIRHSFATHMLERGCNLRMVQELLGHKRLATTQLYTHISKNVLKEAYIKFHPRSN